jgi:AcrR family transcriptional regulator
MSRWEPDSKGRLAAAAIQLYVERGFEQTTVAEIAERAGVTERTFFRHFTDKKDVFFVGQDEFEAMFIEAVESAPEQSAPMQIVEPMLHAVAISFEPRRPWSVERSRVLGLNPGLMERELIKLAHLKTAIATGLRGRGIDEPAASLTAETAVSVFHIAFQTWIQDENTRTFTQIVDDSLAALKAVTAGV